MEWAIECFESNTWCQEGEGKKKAILRVVTLTQEPLRQTFYECSAKIEECAVQELDGVEVLGPRNRNLCDGGYANKPLTWNLRPPPVLSPIVEYRTATPCTTGLWSGTAKKPRRSSPGSVGNSVNVQPSEVDLPRHKPASVRTIISH